MKNNFKVVLITMFLVISFGSFAGNIIVSGAGSPEVDGYYVEDGERDSRPIYKYNDGTTDWAIAWTGFSWALGKDDGSMIMETYYENFNDFPTCPNFGWQAMIGMEPIPMFEEGTLFSGGIGTESDPFEISTLDDLEFLSGYDAYWGDGIYFIQTKNIDASQTSTWNFTTGFSPIGSETTPFVANYNGQGFIISELFINQVAKYQQGFFSFIGENGNVSNLGLVDINFTAYGSGGLCAYNYGTVNNCYTTGSIYGSENILPSGGAGLCVINCGVINNSYSRCSVTGTDGNYSGFCLSNTSDLGLDGTITNCYSTGVVSGENVGGFCAFNTSTITNCFWDTETSGQSTSVGGTGKLTADMKTETTFTDASWDFSTIWKMSSSVNDGYPVLQCMQEPPMELVFTFTANTNIQLPLWGTVNCTVDWGDGSDSENFTSEGLKNHSFSAGTYTVIISGSLSDFGTPSWQGANYLMRVNSFGNLGLTSLRYAFCTAHFMQYITTDLPASVTNLYGAFSYNNSNIANIIFWDVSNVTNMSRMFFSSSNVHQDISDWNVSSVTDMSHMFYSVDLEHDIGGWDVSNVTNMESMFENVFIFNQDIGDWNVSNVTNMTDMFNNTDLSTENYDALLNGWSAQTLQAGVVFNGGDSRYSCAGASARASLIADDTWTITDDGMANTMQAETANLDDIVVQCSVTELTAPNAIDACDESFDATQSDITLPFSTQGTYTINWESIDQAGNIYTQTQTVIVDDITAPTPDVAMLDDIEVECSVDLSTYTPTATDNCVGTVNGTTPQTIFDQQGTYTITWTFDDGNGNSIDVEQNVVVEDVTVPTITCIEDQEVTADETETYIVEGTQFDPISSDDNCEVASITNNINGSATLSGEALAQSETHTITWTVTDGAENTEICSFDVVVNAFVGISNLSELGINIYPNPTTGIFSIETEGNFDVTITDISGKVVLELPNFKTSKVDLTENANGVYFIKFQNSEIVKTVKIIKQ